MYNCSAMVIFALLLMFLLIVHTAILFVLTSFYKAYINKKEEKTLRLTKTIIVQKLKKGK
jgi:hypothetical protein